MTVGIAPVAVKPSIGPVEALDHTRGLKRFEVLINGGVANTPAPGIQLLKNVPCTHMACFTPQQIEHHAALSTEAHTKRSTAFEGVMHPLTDQ